MSTPVPRRAPRQAEAERNDHALLQAAREVLAADGAHASVASIAARAGVGVGSLYRRYRTKEELFQRLCVLSLQHTAEAAERGLAAEDPWKGIAGYVTACVEFGQGSLAPVAGLIKVTSEMRALSNTIGARLDDLVTRAHQAAVLRPEVTPVDISLLIEQLGRSPVIDQLRQQGREDLLPAATKARQRIITIALNGLRLGDGDPLPGTPPTDELFTERWQRLDHPSRQ